MQHISITELHSLYAMPKVRVKFLISKEEKRVVLAEAGSDFVDVLFSFLTLPLGSIVQLLGNQTGLGSLDILYESLEQLDARFLQTEACKKMLLKPRSEAAMICEDLKIQNIHDPNPRTLYLCNKPDCLIQSTCYYTYLKDSQCSLCGELMTRKRIWPTDTSEKGGVFVNETNSFLISDKLQVIPISLKEGFSLLKELKIKDASLLEERVVDFGTEEALNLLKRSLISKNPLTELCFPNSCVPASANCSLEIKEEKGCFSDACGQESGNCFSTLKEEINGNKEEGEITIKLVVNKKNNNVMYAEVGEHFVNQLLSFLAFPLGSVLGLLSENVSALSGCINNLYSSVESMGIDFFVSENCRTMLLYPKLATFYGYEKPLVKLDEIKSKKLSLSRSCPLCYFEKDEYYCRNYCTHRGSVSEVIEQNPKFKKVVRDIGGGFVVDSASFLISDNLHISPLSFISAIGKEMNSPISDLVCKDVCIDKAKAMSLLSAMLISKTVLTDTFRPKLKRSRRSQFL